MEIRFHHNQIGMLIEARENAGSWQTVELQKYTEYRRPGFVKGGFQGTFISTERQEADYLTVLDARGIKYIVNRLEKNA
jgi:hypothetical protein